MKITVTENKEVTYLQVIEGSKPLHKILGQLTEINAGSDVEVVVENNGHRFPFSLVKFDLDPVIRTVNGIITKTAAAPKAIASE